MKLFQRTGPTADEPDSRQSRGRARLKTLLLFPTITLALVAAGQELLFRGLFPFPEVRRFNRINYQMTAQGHPQLGRMLKRGLVYDRLLIESQADGFSEIHNLNLYGFRGPDFSIDPPRGRRRILLIGDSVTEGMGAPRYGTIARECERLLVREGDPAEVINLGVISATLSHVTILARDATFLLHPTDVVVILYANDLPAPAYDPTFDLPGPSFPRWHETWWMPRVVTLFGRFVREEPVYRRWPHAPIRFFAPVPDLANPWSDSTRPHAGLESDLFQEMKAGALNPWLAAQSEDMPRMLAHDFAQGGSPERHLNRIAQACDSVGAQLSIAYVPFCGVVSRGYAPFLTKFGMDRATAESLATDPVYRRVNRILADVCSSMKLPLADTTDDLVEAELAGERQYWEYDTHPRPAGYATIARRIVHDLHGHH
jgi:lysophospholipase L1-like esterase